MCRNELIKLGKPGDDESIIGDECHIVSAAAGGPRHDPDFPQERADRYANLLLLCKVHHKLIDDQEMKYTVPYLTDLKVTHEKWVSEQLESSSSHTRPLRIRRVPENIPAFLQQIRSGKELLAIMSNACAFAPYYDHLRDDMEDELVACFLQDAQDWGELGLLEVSDRIRASRSLDGHLTDLQEAGFLVFGCREKQIIEGGTGPETEWPVAHIRVLRNTNPEITVLSLGPEVHEG